MPPSSAQDITRLYAGAMQLKARQAYPAALAEFRKIIALRPKTPEAHFQIGNILLETGHYRGAVEAFRAAATLKRNEAAIWPPYIRAVAFLCDPDEIAAAGKLLSQARIDKRVAAKSQRILAAQKYASKRLARLAELEGRKNFARIAEIGPDLLANEPENPALAISIGRAHSELGNLAAAVQAYNTAIALDPANYVPVLEKAVVQQRMGDFESAEQTLRQAISISPQRGPAYRLLAIGRKLKAGEEIVAEMERRFDSPDMGEADRMHLGFALSKAMEDTGAHARVFHFLNTANALQKKQSGYDIARRVEEVKLLRDALRGGDFGPAEPDGHVDFAPIFVTGMPRSGTTLVEQIISSHPEVAAAGETTIPLAEVYRVMRTQRGGFRRFAQLTPSEIAGIGTAYRERIARIADFGTHVTDKSIQTYMVMGVIRRAIPGARFIVVRRDPRDNLFSIYKNFFDSGAHGYSNDLRDLATYYRTFVDMLDFWRKEAPGLFHEIRYEDLVTDPEPQTRALISACGLAWDDACLAPQDNRRAVNTLSLQQIRQPIYASSAKAWERYRDDLAPLLEALGELAES